MDRQTSNSNAIMLRPAGADDDEFLFRVYEHTRELERQAVEWTDEEWEEFIRVQFEAQRRYYTTTYPDSEHSIILYCDKPVGRMWVWESESQLRLIDIAILPQFRRRGIGTHLIRGLQARAEQSRIPLRHRVEMNNPDALRLYQRLAFVVFEQQGFHWHLEWHPPSAAHGCKTPGGAEEGSS